MSLPRLEDVVSADDVSQKGGGGKFAADYVNWARIAHYLREEASGWMPFAEPNQQGGIVHNAPDGSGYLLIGFTHADHGSTTKIPHAVMDHTMRAKSNPDARDISDAFVRGMCKAAALLFGLGWKLWSKDDPMERDLSADTKVARHTEAKATKAKKPQHDAFKSMDDALTSLKAVSTLKEFHSWGMRVKFASFDDDELTALREAGVEYSETLKKRLGK